MPGINKQIPVRFLNPSQFFETYVPMALQASRAAAERLGGACAVVLYGPQGGAWTIDFGKCEVFIGANPEVETVVEASSENFCHVLEGKPLDASDPMLRTRGNLKVFSQLALMLNPEAVQRYARSLPKCNPSCTKDVVK